MRYCPCSLKALRGALCRSRTSLGLIYYAEMASEHNLVQLKTSEYGQEIT